MATIDARGLNMGATRKFGNFEADGRVAFVVDDIASVSPWRVRGIEIRGRAEARRDQPWRARASPAPTPGNSTGCPA
jgi:pyridoxamine 5'-phosphate oxidase family protein